MSQMMQCFITLSESLVQAHNVSCVYFTSDLEKFEHVISKLLDLPEVKAGKTIGKIDIIKKCIKGKRSLVGTIKGSTYGSQLKAWVWPAIKNYQVVGTYGFMVPRTANALKDIYNNMANPTESLYEQVLMTMITSKARNKHML